MGLASYFFTKNIDRTWRLLENLEAGMIGMNTGKTHWKLFLYLSNCMQAIHLLLNRPLEESKSLAMERSRAKTLLSTNILSRKQERWLWMAISDWAIPWDHFSDHTHVSKLLKKYAPCLASSLGFPNHLGRGKLACDWHKCLLYRPVDPKSGSSKILPLNPISYASELLWSSKWCKYHIPAIWLGRTIRLPHPRSFEPNRVMELGLATLTSFRGLTLSRILLRLSTWDTFDFNNISCCCIPFALALFFLPRIHASCLLQRFLHCGFWLHQCDLHYSTPVWLHLFW